MDTKITSRDIQKPITEAMPQKVDQSKSEVKNQETSSQKILDKTGFKVQLSDGARELGESSKKALEIARSTDPVRSDRVEYFKEKIRKMQAGEEGGYVLDSGKIADGILFEAVKDRLATEDDPR